LLLAAGFVVPSAAQETAGADSTTPPTYRQRLDKQLTRVSHLTLNARVKLTNGVVGTSAAGNDAEPPSPAQQCCSGNLDKLADAYKKLAAVLDELDQCYARTGDPGSSAVTALFAQELKGYGRSLQAFANAPTGNEALAALDAMTRGYNRMKSSAEDVAPCEGP
jgi:hypothetical protein